MPQFRPIIARRRAYLMPGEAMEVLKSCAAGSLGDDSELDAWESAFAAYVGQPHAAVAPSGRRAMQVALQHLGVGAGDDVVIPAYTFHGLLKPIADLGARAVPADIDAHTLGVTAESIARRLTPRTRAIVALHAFGAPCELGPILELARDRRLPLIEDCAHSLGARLYDRSTGSFGHASFFSFESAKPVHTYGGGMLASGDAALARSVRRASRSQAPSARLLSKKLLAVLAEQALFDTGLALPPLTALASERWSSVVERLYASTQAQVPAGVGYAPLQARIGLRKLAGLDARVSARLKAAQQLASLLDARIAVQQAAAGAVPNGYAFVARLPVPAGPARRALLAHGIDAGVGDELTDDCAARLGHTDCTTLDEVRPYLIQLPLHDQIGPPQIERIAAAVNAVCA